MGLVLNSDPQEELLLFFHEVNTKYVTVNNWNITITAGDFKIYLKFVSWNSEHFKIQVQEA